MSRALILLGHGSHLNADSSAPVFRHAATIRASGSFDQVLEAFWKEEPSLRDAIDLVDADEIFVVPMFLADGYFTRTVLPRELGLEARATASGSQRVWYLPPIGTHPSMPDLILRRAAEVSGLDESARRAAALIVIGHGTDRSDTSGNTVYSLVNELRERAGFGQIDCGFLDEAPRIADVIERVEAPNIVLVPFFLADGWHTRETIPADLGLDGAVTRRGAQTVWYTDPVGTMPAIADVVQAIATDPSVKPISIQPAASGVREARERFADSVTTAGGGWLEILEVGVRGTKGGYQLFHRDDAESVRAAGSPAQEGDPAPNSDRPDNAEADRTGGQGSTFRLRPGPGTQEPAPGDAAHRLEVLANRFSTGRLADADLRELALELARYDAAGEYRPLRTAPTLIRGWLLESPTADELWTVIEALYPAAILHWHQLETGMLNRVDFPEWAARQTAMYSVVRELGPAGVQSVVDRLCEPCLRHRVWQIHTTPASDSQTAVSSLGRDGNVVIPCREPCTVFATSAREEVSTSCPDRNDAAP